LREPETSASRCFPMDDRAETHRRLVYLRSRAAYYRQQVEEATVPEQVVFCRGMAEAFERDAAVLEETGPSDPSAV
jgi:hypothetical protein